MPSEPESIAWELFSPTTGLQIGRASPISPSVRRNLALRREDSLRHRSGCGPGLHGWAGNGGW